MSEEQFTQPPSSITYDLNLSSGSLAVRLEVDFRSETMGISDGEMVAIHRLVEDLQASTTSLPDLPGISGMLVTVTVRTRSR